jgi:hypothetical protein
MTAEITPEAIEAAVERVGAAFRRSGELPGALVGPMLWASPEREARAEAALDGIFRDAGIQTDQARRQLGRSLAELRRGYAVDDLKPGRQFDLGVVIGVLAGVLAREAAGQGGEAERSPRN